MDTTLEYWEKKVKDAKVSLEEAETVLRVLKRESNITAQKELENKPELLGDGEIDLGDLNVPINKTLGSTLLTNIKEVVKRFGKQEFTINHIKEVLHKTGKGSDAKHFNNRISVTVHKLLKEEFLIRTFKGSGNVPHKYRRAMKK